VLAAGVLVPLGLEEQDGAVERLDVNGGLVQAELLEGLQAAEASDEVATGLWCLPQPAATIVVAIDPMAGWGIPHVRSESDRGRNRTGISPARFSCVCAHTHRPSPHRAGAGPGRLRPGLPGPRRAVAAARRYQGAASPTSGAARRRRSLSERSPHR